jgi:hypothetical protein
VNASVYRRHRRTYEASLIAKNNLHDWDFDIVIQHGVADYICGEETALLESLEGREGVPPTNTGTKFFCVNNLCNVEEAMGIPLRELLERHAGGGGAVGVICWLSFPSFCGPLRAVELGDLAKSPTYSYSSDGWRRATGDGSQFIWPRVGFCDGAHDGRSRT